MTVLPRSSFLTLSGPIGQLVPWMLSPIGGSIRLAPVGFFPKGWRREAIDVKHILLLSDLGYLDGRERAERDRSSLEADRSHTEIVLLLPSTLLPMVSELRLKSQSTFDAAAIPLFSEEWLPTWHHFVTTSEGAPSLVNEQTPDFSDDQSSFLAVNGRRRYVFGSQPGDPSSVPVGLGGVRPALSKRLAKDELFAALD